MHDPERNFFPNQLFAQVITRFKRQGLKSKTFIHGLNLFQEMLPTSVDRGLKRGAEIPLSVNTFSGGDWDAPGAERPRTTIESPDKTHFTIPADIELMFFLSQEIELSMTAVSIGKFGNWNYFLMIFKIYE